MGRPKGKPRPPVVARLMRVLECYDLFDLAMRLGASLDNVRNWDKGRPVPDKWLRAAEEQAPGVIEELRRLNQTPQGTVQMRHDGAKPEDSGFAPAVADAAREAHARPSRGLVFRPPPSPSDGWVLPLTGDGALLVTGGLLAPQTASLARPLVLPVQIGSAQREYQVIPSLRMAALAGRPGATTRAGRLDAATVELAGSMAFDRAWLRDHLGRDGGGFVSVSVSGDSMEPALFDGDTIIIDTLVDRVDASGVYVIRLGVDLLVKRIQRRLDGALIISSDNKKYEAEELSAARSGELRVEGRLVWPRLR
jgi:hypothetical protein